MASISNLQVIVDLYASFATGDAAAMSRPFNDESVWVESDNNVRSGAFRGVQAIGE
jgi:ketosteroid isomerase-like protein